MLPPVWIRKGIDGGFSIACHRLEDASCDKRFQAFGQLFSASRPTLFDVLGGNPKRFIHQAAAQQVQRHCLRAESHLENPLIHH